MRCLDVVRSDWRLPLTCVACDGCMQRRATGGDQSPSLRLHDFVCACEDLVFLFIALHFLFFKIIYSAAFSFQPREVPRGAKPHRVQASSFSQVWGVHGTLLSLVLLRGLVLGCLCVCIVLQSGMRLAVVVRWRASLRSRASSQSRSTVVASAALWRRQLTLPPSRLLRVCVCLAMNVVRGAGCAARMRTRIADG
jgi:hypothetical protein